MSYRLLIAVPRPLRNLLSYTSINPISPGQRVSVPLGHGKSCGLVIATEADDSNNTTNFVIKKIHHALDEFPLLDEHLLEFLLWAANYYQHPPGEVVFAALPAALRSGAPIPAPPEPLKYWQVILPKLAAEQHLKHAPRQRELYNWLCQQAGPVSSDQLRQECGQSWQNYLRGLLDKELVIEATPPEQVARTTSKQASMVLTSEQQNCLTQCQEWLSQTTQRPILLHGVTGSGKTEIYLRLLSEVLAQGKQAMILVPEIGLTPQLVQRFQAFFPEYQLVALHSRLNNTERLQAWLQARNGGARIIIGTRSAIFTPCPDLGIIVVDEEHDLSFKQQEGFRYHGRDLAIKRAHLLNIPIILGSATPALETLNNTDQGRYHYIQLNQRPGKARPPQLEVQDIRGLELQAGLSEQSLQGIRETLQKNEQVLVFINRRGFAPVLLCSACGWQAECPSCSSHMTYHARNSRLICHHCDTNILAHQQCPDCANPKLMTQGQGTERIELILNQYFTDTTVIRVDRDSTSRKGALQKQLATIHTTERLLLVGTQMLAKGHDFPNLTLVVVLDIDQALLSAEYHALERMGQLLTQVAGRAGRSNKPGRVILQTTQPQHPVLLVLLEHGYLMFARQLLSERKRWNFPPFGYQALLRANAKEMETALETLNSIRTILLSITDDISLLGPVPAPMEKRAGRYRAQLLLQCKNRQQRHINLKKLLAQEKNIQNRKGVRWSIDIDPVELG